MPVLLAQHSFDCNLCHVVARHGCAHQHGRYRVEIHHSTFCGAKIVLFSGYVVGLIAQIPFCTCQSVELFFGLSPANPCRRYLTTDCESGQSSLETMPPFPGKLRAGLGHVLHCHPSQAPVLSCICIFGSSLAWPVFGTTGWVMLGQNSADTTLADTKVVCNVHLF